MVYLGVVIAMGHFSALAGGIALGSLISSPSSCGRPTRSCGWCRTPRRRPRWRSGAPRWRTIWSVVLPAAAPGILDRRDAGAGAGVGGDRAAAVHSLSNQFLSTDILQPIAALPQLIFANSVNVQTPQSLELAWGAALVLVAIILFLNIVARIIAARVRPPEGR